ncbi:S-layer homology domain-containing protein [Paenibacillus antibioticophila]|uniref:S-layer homology domain-containing protein n=1 Tax=Paenibacillus antibioticophila TaxID=1274374 RepID=UPI000677F71D|nr:S-layer homology domain-containing protein [Paenibacillus antibioticophila]
MSNTSYSIKRNSHVIDNQGGEKKVMKKILSVALSTAMAFSMFASVAFGADANLTPQQKFDVLKQANIMDGMPDGSSALEKTLTRAELAKIIVKSIGLEPITGVATYKDKNYTVNHWAAPFIEAATQAGILNGKDEAKQLFDPSGNVTVQELAKVLVAALKLEVPAEANNSASEWAKGYVAAAVKEGFLPEGINYQANATRSQAIVAAYAIYEANQVPTVASYKVVDPKNVEFTMSDDEVVKVALETALEANKETEVKFTYQDREYTHKVTYVTTVAQTVQSVKADNLKQIVVTFDGTVDATSAGLESNYSVADRTFKSATVSEDKTSVTLLFDEAHSLTNQKEFELSINNVKNGDSTKTFTQKVKFTPVDVTTPTVKEVVGLGTKAVKIKFSEPVQRAEAVKSANYKIDGKAIGASIVYSYPDTVILSTNLTEGDHKISVSNVADASGLKVVPVDYDFTATVDTAAPEVVSATSKDLREVTVEFNEPIKAVNSAYANVSGNTGIIEINDNKVTVKFTDDKKALNYSENTIYLKGVRDYSDNSADREVKVNPTLDTVRPEVLSYELKNENGNYIAKVKFSEALKTSTVEDRTNYVLKDSEGKVADKAGTDAKGNPIEKPSFDVKNNTVTINLGNDLDNKSYTLTISGLQDTAYVPNSMLPYTIDLDAAKAQVGAISRAWVEPYSDGRYVYIEFNKPVATSGVGDASDYAKYFLVNGTSEERLAAESGDVTIISSDTVRIFTKKSVATGSTIRANYVANADGNYFVSTTGGYVLETVVKDQAIALSKATATSTKEVKLEFDGKLNYIDYTDFRVGTYTPTSYTVSSDYKTLYLKFEGSGRELPADAETKGLKVTTVRHTTQDVYGNAVKLVEASNGNAATPNINVVDDVAPELIDNGLVIKPSATTAVYEATLTFTEAIDVSNAGNYAYGLEGLFEVKVKDKAATINNVYSVADDSTLGTNQLKVVFTLHADNNNTIALTDQVLFKYTADYSKAITDISNARKTLSKFEVNELYDYIN